MKTLYERAKEIKKGLTNVRKDTINVDSLSSGGLLNTQQVKKFISWIFDSTQLLNAARTMIMQSTEVELSGLLMTSRRARGVGINQEIYGGQTQGQMDSEDQGAFGRNVGSYKIAMAAKELALPYILQENMLQDNIEGQSIASTIAQYFATQFGIDLEDLCINGEVVDRNPASPITVALSANAIIGATRILTGAVDPRTVGFPDSSTTGYLYYDHGGGDIELITYDGVSWDGAAWGFDNCVKGATNEDTGLATSDLQINLGESVGWYKHHLLGVDDGWLYKIKNTAGGVPGNTLYDASTVNGGVLAEDHFIDMLKLLPRKYRQNAFRNRLRWVMNEDLVLDWIQRLTDRNTTLGDAAIKGELPNPQNVPILVSSAFPDDKVLLTDPVNLISGVYKQINVRSTNQGRSAIFKNERYYITRARVACQIERADAVVLAENFV